MINQKKIGLALSGGGYRAATFHLGTLRALEHLGILKEVDVISTISGGSITGAYYCLHRDKDFQSFEDGLKQCLKKNIISEILKSAVFLRFSIVVMLVLIVMIILLFTDYAWISFLILAGLFVVFMAFQFKLLPLSKVTEQVYNSTYYGGKALKDLKAKPVLAINATNLATARLWTFTRNYMGDSAYTSRASSPPFKAENFPIARAVASSTCVPFAFTPVAIDQEYFNDKELAQVIKPNLIDGGVLDNQGIHKLTHEKSRFHCQTIITSDAGTGWKAESEFNNIIGLMVRTCDIFMQRIKNLQFMENIYENTNEANREIAYLSLGWDLHRCIPGFINNLKDNKIPDSVIEAHSLQHMKLAPDSEIQYYLEKKVGYDQIVAKISDEDFILARSVTTNLKTLKDTEVEALIKCGFALTLLQVRLYCPSIICSSSR